MNVVYSTLLIGSIFLLSFAASTKINYIERENTKSAILSIPKYLMAFILGFSSITMFSSDEWPIFMVILIVSAIGYTILSVDFQTKSTSTEEPQKVWGGL